MTVVDELHVIMMSYHGSRGAVPSLVYKSQNCDGVVHVFQLDWRLSCRIVYV